MKYSFLDKKPDIKILKSINVSNIEWCDEAVLIHIKNGKGTLAHQISEKNEEYEFFSQLLLDNKPIIQGKYPICPTCAGMLATGYGIENIDSPELKKVRECMNSEYKDIMNAAENIKPLLALLNDGYYILADIKLYPSDGQGAFFYSVPNELTYNEASCSEYYDSEFFCSAECYPAYIYPTQSCELIHEKRVDEYIHIMKNCSNPPRGLAYYEKGFVCALLDGHHKACAASALGKRLNCITIIEPDNFQFVKGTKYADRDTLIEKVGFAGIMIDTESGTKMKDYLPIKGVKQNKLNISVYHLTGRKLPERYISTYPTIHTLAGIINAEVDISGNVADYAKSLLLLRNEENATKLDYFKYLVDHNPKDSCWEIVNSYWD